MIYKKEEKAVDFDNGISKMPTIEAAQKCTRPLSLKEPFNPLDTDF